MPDPAPFPSRLSCSGQVLVDANGYVLPPMRGLCVNPSTLGRRVKPSWADFAAMKAKGARLIRMELWWGNAEATPGVLSSTWIAHLDNAIANCVSNGLYVIFTYAFNGKSPTPMPTWAQQTLPQGSLQNYVSTTNPNKPGVPAGEFWTQYVANRYGNPSSPQYTQAVIGAGINEPVPDYHNTTGWLTNCINEQVQGATWVRAVAPSWIWTIAPGNAAGCAMLPNATGSGQSTQTFTGAAANPLAGVTPPGNFILEVHDPVKCADADPASTDDGRNTTNGRVGSSIVQIKNATYPGYPPAITGMTRAVCQAQHTRWWANYLAYASASYANCPIYIAEANWAPVSNQSGPGGASGTAYLSDKLAIWNSLTPLPVAITQWEYHTDQDPDEAAVRPGTGPGVVGVGSDGWLVYTTALLAEPPVNPSFA